MQLAGEGEGILKCLQPMRSGIVPQLSHISKDEKSFFILLRVPRQYFLKVIGNLQSQCLKGEDLKTKTVFQLTDPA